MPRSNTFDRWSHRPLAPSARFRIALGACFLGSGTALVVHIIAGYSLRAALSVTLAFVFFVGVYTVRRASADVRSQLIFRARTGLIAGAVATVLYDVTKALLSRFDASPYSPFEAIRIFGELIAGPAGSGAVVYVSGATLHGLNGVTFGTAYCLLARQPKPLTGMAWGIFLETFQLTLYPGWLDVRFYEEFVQISAISHLVYGLTLGLLCQRAGVGDSLPATVAQSQ